MLGLITRALEAYLWYLTFFRPVAFGAQLCKQNQPRAADVTNVTMALIFGWIMEAADRLFLSSFIAMRWLYLIMRIVVCLYLQHPKLLGANRVYELAFAGIVDRYGPVVDSLVLQHMEKISEMGLVQYATNAGLAIVRMLSGVMEMGQALIETSTATSVEPAPLPRRLSQERDRRDEAGDLRTAPPRREPLVTVTYMDPTEPVTRAETKRARPPAPPVPPRASPPRPRFEPTSDDSGDYDDATPFATVQRSRTTEAPYGHRIAPPYSYTSPEL